MSREHDALYHFMKLQKRYTTQHNGKMCSFVDCAISAITHEIKLRDLINEDRKSINGTWLGGWASAMSKVGEVLDDYVPYSDEVDE